ncbi:stage V sporulation protein AD [Anaeroselena agilis]|uniref:Stage V sporulation protein AD n=1 Tax=Anaeroselena agilis TaxID=3063788 RepID=A0ABU3NWA9_9FIRM|nr:stage V sporulation protein AD [Selenomonadales bacterium 4137-cl]
MNKKSGKQTIAYAAPPFLVSAAAVAGPMEEQGLLGGQYDRILEDNLAGQDSWEKTESLMLELALNTAVNKMGGALDDIDFILAGDLLNQLMSSHFAARSLGRPFLGLYGACSTMAESMLLGAVLVDGGFASMVAAAVSSHHDAAERQYRYPTELGVQRPPAAQWTVTGAGAVVLSREGNGPRVTAATVGKVVDAGLKDPNAMGPAMAPAAADTLWQHLQDTGRQPNYYDIILTGDLGQIGKTLLIQLMQEKGVDIAANYEDCGLMIYKEEQDPHAGASGCASSALVLCGHAFPLLVAGRLKRILLIGTGSLHSPTSYQQKETLPAIAHAVAIEA